MRLIDADKVYNDLANNLASIMGDGSDGVMIDLYNYIGEVIHDTFDEQPTAYDVDAVVKQLEEWTFNADINIGDGTIMNHDLIVSKNAIEIVKADGFVSDQDNLDARR